MKMNDVVKKAKKLGIKAKAVKKADLIRQIQTAEGNFDCFGTAVDFCDQWKCCFREDCLLPPKVQTKVMRSATSRTSGLRKIRT